MTEQSLEQIQRQLALLKRQKAALEARDRLMSFTKFTMPDPTDPNDAEKSVYENALHHDAVAAALEEVEKGNYQFLILTMPPRHGKSELVSRRFPAWFLGRHPDWNVVVSTYNDDFAMDFGAEVRKIMVSPQFKQVFPGVGLTRGGAAKDRLQTTQGGMATFVGVGGSLTGRGAHCFPAGTLVETNCGPIPIENLKDCPLSVMALSYDRQSQQTRFRRIQAFSARKASRLLRVTTSAGRVVDATPDHRFLTSRGYVEARSLTPGDRLVCAVQRDGGEAGVRDQQAREARADGVFLLKHLLGRAPERESSRQGGEPVCGVWRSGAEGHSVWDAQDAVLHEDLYGNGQGAKKAGTARRAPVDELRGVREAVSVQPQPSQAQGRGGLVANTVLREDMRRPRAIAEDVGRHQSRLPARVDACAQAAAFGEGVSGSPARDIGAGQGNLRVVPQAGQSPRTPHQSPTNGQPLVQPDLSLLGLSSSPSCQREGGVRAEEDVVLAVDECPVGAGGVEVYDIQVEEDHNFFANGVCVHNCLIVDDLIKDYEQARSKAFRDRAWDWFTKVAMTRRMGPKLVVITFTRWHQDDIIGRLTDPENEFYNRKLAEKIKIINLPAVAEDDDPLGRPAGQPLWDRFGLDFLEEQRTLDPLGFEALYQQRPSVADGILFRREHVQYYDPGQLDERDLRIYCASDHAVTTNQRSDSTVLLRVGVDRQNHIYVLDCWWQKAQTDAVVEAMITMARQDPKPLVWWAEKGHISKSIGPFLRKRMAETQSYFNLVEVTPAADKQQRAQAISARMAMGFVHFPKGKPWVEKAINELLSFPNGLHDDWVDAFAYIGLGLQMQIPLSSARQNARPAPKSLTFGWVKAAQKEQDRRIRLSQTGGF